MHLNRGPYVTLLPNSSYLSATTLTIAAGAIIFIVGFCGCVGAMMESQCMLIVVSEEDDIFYDNHGRIQRGGGQGVRTPPGIARLHVLICAMLKFSVRPLLGIWTPPPP